MIIKKGLNIISGIFFSLIILVSAWSLVPTVSRELDSGISGILIVTSLVAVSFLLSVMSGRLEKILSEKQIAGDYIKADRIFCVMAVGLLVMQIFFTFCQDFIPRNDLSYVCQGAENLVTGRPLYENIPEIHKHYFAVYPNNHALFAVIYGLYRIEYFLTGNVTNTLPTILNTASLDISYILMYMTAKIIYTPEKSLLCAVRGLMFTPLITYTAFFYTDSMAMPFIAGALYLYMKWRSSCGDKVKDVFYISLCGIILASAYKLKGSSAIFIPAVITDIIFLNRKRKFVYFGLLMTMFVICCIIMGGIFRNIINIDAPEMEKYRFPLVHWIMMSADGRGGYCAEDFRYTLSFSGYDRKVSADIDRLTAKLSAEGISGFAEHLLQKISYTWRDGTYMAGYYNKYSFLKSYGFYIFTGLCHFTMLSGTARRCFSGKDTGSEFMPRIMLVGLAVFLMIWEARCRYLVSFFVLFALT